MISVALLSFSCTFLYAIERDFKVSCPVSTVGEKNTLVTKEAGKFLQNFVEPNFTDCDRANEIKEHLKNLDNPCAKIPLVEELFKIKLKAFQNQGFSIDGFLQEAKEWVKNDEYFIYFENAQDDIKAELLGLYHLLLYLSWDSTRIQYVSSGELSLPFLRLFDFEQEVEFPLFGVRLLDAELVDCSLVLLCLEVEVKYKDYVRHTNNWWEPFWKSREIATQFYWGPQFSFFKRLLNYIDDDQCLEMQYLRERVMSAVMDYFSPYIYQLFPQIDKESDPLIHFFPYIIKFKSIEDIEGYFDKRFEHMAAWDREALWVDLHFRAVESMETVDLTKAYNYLEKAEKEIDQNLWAYPFSTNYFVWSEKRQKALELLNEWKAKLALKDAM